jgi:hypothetical protein
MAYKFRQYPEFSWSQSRDALLQECPLKYYFNYYASHNGWLDDATPEQRKTYLLKQLANLHLVLGSAIHDVAEKLVPAAQQSGTLPSVDEVKAKVKNALNGACKSSQDLHAWTQAPKKSVMLHEMYYDKEIPPHLIASIGSKITPCSDHLLSSHTIQELLREGAHIQILEAESMKTTPFEGEALYVIPDLVYHRQRDDRYVIVDWKTGKEYEQNEQQTLLYAMYAGVQYGVPVEKIEIRLEYLLAGTHKTIFPSLEQMEQVKQWIRLSIEQMKRRLENVALNKPLDQSFFDASPDHFKCKGCNFREICPASAG